MENSIKRVNIEDIKVGDTVRHDDKITKYFIDSLKQYGSVYPIIITKDNVLIDGKRRLLALKERAVKAVNVIVADSDKEELELVLNIQREDLNPIEKAKAFKSFIEKRNISQRKAAKILGISKSTIEHHIKLLELPEEAKEELIKGKIKPYSRPIEKQYRKRLKTPEEFKKVVAQSQFASLVNRLISFRDFLKSSSLDITEYSRIKELLNEIMNIVDIKIISPPNLKGQVKHEDFGKLLEMKARRAKYDKKNNLKRKWVNEHSGKRTVG